MLDHEVSSFVSRLVDGVGDKIESIVSYSHPFTGGGLLIAPTQSVTFIPDLIAEIYSYGPPRMGMIFLRTNELFQLSYPGLFGWPRPLEEKPHLAFWLKNRGVVHYGRDIRDEIAIPLDKSSFLETHIQRCKQFIRNWSLDQLRRRNYRGMAEELERQGRYLMATALLSQGEWEVQAETVAKRFGEVFGDPRACELGSELAQLSRRIENVRDEDLRESALEALWLFECLISQLTRVKQ